MVFGSFWCFLMVLIAWRMVRGAFFEFWKNEQKTSKNIKKHPEIIQREPFVVIVTRVLVGLSVKEYVAVLKALFDATTLSETSSCPLGHLPRRTDTASSPVTVRRLHCARWGRAAATCWSHPDQWSSFSFPFPLFTAPASCPLGFSLATEFPAFHPSLPPWLCAPPTIPPMIFSWQVLRFFGHNY